MELIVKEFEKHGEIEKVEIHNNTTGEIYTLGYKNDVYDTLSELGFNNELNIKFEIYSFDWLVKNEYVRIK